ncbi:hypothetical protein MMC07_000284 [Pseudocyphellaria aurata]|nr:hypothetical protein [Pseudocyphellaria aurata]
MGSTEASTEASTGYYPITGIHVGLGPGDDVPSRMDIDEWWRSDDPVHKDQVSLFIAALKVFQAIPDSEKLSYFRIAGIHKEPLKTWDEPKEEDNRKGYCEHRTNRFPTWHRAYILLFEQRLFRIMVNSIIPKFPLDQQSYLRYAAQQWRLPFWDWASKKPVESVYDPDGHGDHDYDVPQLVRLESVEIRGPAGWKWVKNPLYVFRMPKGISMGDAGVKTGKMKDCKATSRYPPTNEKGLPISGTFIDGYQDNDSIMRKLRDRSLGGDEDKSATASGIPVGGNISSSLREAFYRIVAMDNYEHFSNALRPEGSSEVMEWNSLEALHDTIHLWCGGGNFGEPAWGHMALPLVAAFDPIFWLHHCNVDRAFAMWQAIHPRENDPSNWFAKQEDGRRDLKPFRKNKDGVYWNSDDVYDTANLGYTYPTLPKKRRSQDAKFNDLDDEQLNALKKKINESYGSTRRCEQKAAETKVRSEPLTLEDALRSVPLSKIKAQIPLNADNEHEPKDQLDVNDYLVNIKYERFALGGRPFTIHILIGRAPVDNTSLDVIEFKNLVGEIYNFVAPIDEEDGTSGGCANCKAQAKEKSESTGQIVLTNALMTRYKQKLIHENRQSKNNVLESMDPEVVIEFLKCNLHWRITELNGSFIPKEQLPSLRVAVAGGKADHYADSTKLSVYRDYKVLYDITAGREGGACPEDNLFG